MEIIYDYLSKYGFSSYKSVDKNAFRLGQNEIDQFFDGYKEIASRAKLLSRATVGAINIFPDSWSSPIPVPLVRQLCLYADVIYLHDPILDSWYEWETRNINPAYVIRYPDLKARIGALITDLVEKIKTVISLRPLLLAGIVQFVPTQLMGPQKEPGALYATSFYGPKMSGKDLLSKENRAAPMPDAIIEYAEANLKVYPVKIVNGTQKIFRLETLVPSRMIAVVFHDDPRPKIFNLLDVKITDEATRKIGMFLDLSGEEQPVDIETFQNWVNGTKEEVLLERVGALQRDLYLSAQVGAKFLTNLPTSRDLAGLDLRNFSGSTESVVSALLRVSLPYFEGVTEAQLVKARKNEAAFAEFRTAMDKAFKDIYSQSGNDIQIKTEEIVRDVLLGPISKVERKMKSLKRNLFLDALMFAGTLGATILTNGNTLTSAAALVVTQRILSDYKAQKSEEDKIKESPGFFFWEVTKNARRK